jgi:hypothetical protein
MVSTRFLAVCLGLAMGPLMSGQPVGYVQQGLKLVATPAVGQQALSMALSEDGNTALVAGLPAGQPTWPVWVFVRSTGGLWHQSAQLTGTGASGTPNGFAFSVALSGDGTTALVGLSSDNASTGAAWVFTSNGAGGPWSQQGTKLVGTGAVGNASQGYSVALSANGNTALIGGTGDSGNTGAAWVFTRSSGVWTQQTKLVGSGAVGGTPQLGSSVALSGDGFTAAVGGPGDNSSAGATWVFVLSAGGVWFQEGFKLVGTGVVGSVGPYQGLSVALNGDGTTLLVGGDGDNSSVGAAWVFTESSGVFSQQGNKLVGTGAVGPADQGGSVALSIDGNTAAIGGRLDNSGAGATWVFTRSGVTWSQLAGKIVGSGAQGTANQGSGVALSGDASTLLVGGPADDLNVGASWPFVVTGPAPSITSLSPATGAFQGPAFTLTVNGANFLPGALVEPFEGEPFPTTFVSNSQLTAAVPASLLDSEETISIVVVNPDGNTSAPSNFTVTGPPCSFTFSPASLSLPATGTSIVEACPGVESGLQCGVENGPETQVSFAVTPSAACGQSWSATSSNPAVLQIMPGAGNGQGFVSFTLTNNTHISPQTYTITVIGGAPGASAGSTPYTVTEAGSPLTGSVGQTYREIYALYEQILGRDPDPTGFAFWTGAGSAGLGQMADSFLTSPEAFGRNFGIIAAYQATMGAPPTYAQFTAAVESEASLPLTCQPIGTPVCNSLFNSLIASNPSYTAVTLYQNLLNRQPSASEIAACNIGQSALSGLPGCFETLIGYPSNSTPIGSPNNEFQNTGTFQTAPDHSNALYIQMLYLLILSRNPDAAGLSFWTGVANTGGPGILFQGAAGYPTRIQILGPGTPDQGFIGSPEFQGLFAN